MATVLYSSVICCICYTLTTQDCSGDIRAVSYQDSCSVLCTYTEPYKAFTRKVLRFSNQLPAHIRVFGKLNRLLQLYPHHLLQPCESLIFFFFFGL